jgi:hypothetical protein
VTLERNAFRIPRGVDHVISVRPRWIVGQPGAVAGYVVIRIWHDGQVEDIVGNLDRAAALLKASEVAQHEGTVYLRAPDDVSRDLPGPLFGDVAGVSVGQRFKRREDLRAAGLHRRVQGGIDWTSEGALAIVFAGGYADDEWSDADPWYTGMGGQDRPGGRQVEDQTATLGNRALLRNLRDGLPVRVIRRVESGIDYAYQYEGLFHVVDHTYAPSKDGPRVYRFQLRRAAQ